MSLVKLLSLFNLEFLIYDQKKKQKLSHKVMVCIHVKCLGLTIFLGSILFSCWRQKHTSYDFEQILMNKKCNSVIKWRKAWSPLKRSDLSPFYRWGRKLGIKDENSLQTPCSFHYTTPLLKVQEINTTPLVHKSPSFPWGLSKISLLALLRTILSTLKVSITRYQ